MKTPAFAGVLLFTKRKQASRRKPQESGGWISESVGYSVLNVTRKQTAMSLIPMDDRAKHYAIVAQAIGYIRTHALQQPSLQEIADEVRLSEFHLQRVFTAWAGVSPKRFLQYLTKEHAKQVLRESADVLSTALTVGLSGPGRLHDLMISWEAMTPGEIKGLGTGVTLSFGFAPTPFGPALFAWTARGLCHVEFCELADEGIERLRNDWSAATLIRDDTEADRLARQIFEGTTKSLRPLNVILCGSSFQLKVWEALVRTEPCQLLSYGQLASLAGVPNAQRAVGTALAANSLAYLIPCHRVIRQNGETGNYRWGTERKLAIQGWEAAKADQQMNRITG